MPVGKKILDVLNQISGDVGGMSNAALGGLGEPSAQDIISASAPPVEARGFGGILGRVNQMGAQRRVTAESEARKKEAEQQQRETHAADIALKGAQTESTKALAPQREAQAAYTKSRIESDRLNIELKSKLGTETLRLRGVKDQADIKAANDRVQALFQQNEIALKNALTNARNADTAFERQQNEDEVRRQLADVAEDRNTWEAEVARAMVGVRRTAAENIGNQNITVNTQQNEPGIRIGEGNNTIDIPIQGNVGFFKLFEKGQPLFKQFGGNEAILGLGGNEVPVAPVEIKNKKTQTRQKTGETAPGQVKVRILKPGGKYKVGDVVLVSTAAAKTNADAGNVEIVK